MSFSYKIGLRHIVLEDAPFWNCNAIEDVGNLIQVKLNVSDFRVRELFQPHEETLTGTDNKVFSYIWENTDVSGIEPSSKVPEGLLDLAPMIFEPPHSAPSICELPGPGSQILVPNLPIGNKSPFEEQLIWHQEFDCRNDLVFGTNSMTIGSLNAEIHAFQSSLKENNIKDAFIDVFQEILSQMVIAQKYDLFFTFKY